MFWIFLLTIVLVSSGCYVAYKEAKHHELHKLRACFGDIHEKIEKVKASHEAQEDPESIEVFRGELLGIEKALEVIKDEGADSDLMQEIENDIKKVKEKVTSLFNK